jgi:hypothetical protein
MWTPDPPVTKRKKEELAAQNLRTPTKLSKSVVQRNSGDLLEQLARQVIHLGTRPVSTSFQQTAATNRDLSIVSVSSCSI